MIRGHDHHRRPRPRAALASDPAAAADATTPLRRPARIDDRACLVGIVYQLRTGVPWRLLPTRQLGCASPVTSVLLEAMVDAVAPVKGPRGRPGRPRKRPAKLHGDKGYDHRRCRLALRRRGITSRIARRGIESSQRLGRHRYVVERSLAWLVGYRRLQVRYERRSDIMLGFLHLACALICLKSLNRTQV
jgi:transposase